MRNEYPGRCYVCAKSVAIGEGFAERNRGAWRMKHAIACEPYVPSEIPF